MPSAQILWHALTFLGLLTTVRTDQGGGLGGLQYHSASGKRLLAYDINGSEVTENKYYYPGGSDGGSLFFSTLVLDEPSNLVRNNLGGQGPRLSDPPHIKMRSVTTLRGDSVAMRVYNTSVYRPARSLANSFRYRMFELNLRNIYASPAELNESSPSPFQMSVGPASTNRSQQ